MVTEIGRRVAAVLPTPSAITSVRPVGATDVRVNGGFWADRLAVDRERTIPHGFDELQRVGNLANLRLAAGSGEGSYQALGVMFDQPFPFLDSDVYKWLEAAGWELGRGQDHELARAAEEAIAAVAAAQRPDGYINSFVQVLAQGREYRDLAWGHELYCIGHLIQAAIAWHRALGDDRLLDVATRAVDSVERALGPTGRDGLDGHPGIEMALVELYRTTGERKHLDLAARFVGLRGHGLLGSGRFGAGYWQDHAPVGEAAEVAGHAVRQLYLECGVVDVATEIGDAGLLDAVLRRWYDMVATRMYLTGGLGSRHRDEAFGDPYELPPDGAYAETCAAIASVMLAWRLLLATGDPACADVIERTMYNGVLPGMSLDGTRFFYVNTLQRRSRRAVADGGRGERAAWYPCACCPPNLMRLLSSWQQFLATTDNDGVQLQQYAAAEIRADVGGDQVGLAIDSDYPWGGTVKVTIRETPARPWTLSLRVPAWCRQASLDGRVADGPMIHETRSWRVGDSIVLDLDMPARVTEPDRRVDAIRGCVALERGPLVYCVESADIPAGTLLEDLEVDATSVPAPVPRPDLGAGHVGLAVPAVSGDRATPTFHEIGAIPYFAWANRSPGAMRVWIPRRLPPSGDA